jgi:hypothetical protein
LNVEREIHIKSRGFPARNGLGVSDYGGKRVTAGHLVSRMHHVRHLPCKLWGGSPYVSKRALWGFGMNEDDLDRSSKPCPA